MPLKRDLDRFLHTDFQMKSGKKLVKHKEKKAELLIPAWIPLTRTTASHNPNTKGREGEGETKWKTRSVSTGQIRQAGGLASEDLIGLTLLICFSFLWSKKSNSVSRRLEGISLFFFQELSSCGQMTSSWFSSSSQGVEGTLEVLSIICNVNMTLFYRPVSLVA